MKTLFAVALVVIVLWLWALTSHAIVRPPFPVKPEPPSNGLPTNTEFVKW